ncbi:MAG: hypothetical protein KKB20_20070 [Proteobacteria bacterium]|nr:hypothetical protein [Pseudomonadota bacterium]
MSGTVDQAFIRQMQKKVEDELRKKEREVLEYWRGEVDKLLRRRHQDLAGLASDLKTLKDRMEKRLAAI